MPGPPFHGGLARNGEKLIHPRRGPTSWRLSARPARRLFAGVVWGQTMLPAGWP